MSNGLSGLYKNTKGAKEAEKRNRERERLIALIIESVDGCARNWAEVIADHLLANGVKVEIPNNSVSLINGHFDGRSEF